MLVVVRSHSRTTTTAVPPDPPATAKDLDEQCLSVRRTETPRSVFGIVGCGAPGETDSALRAFRADGTEPVMSCTALPDGWSDVTVRPRPCLSMSDHEPRFRGRTEPAGARHSAFHTQRFLPGTLSGRRRCRDSPWARHRSRFVTRRLRRTCSASRARF